MYSGKRHSNDFVWDNFSPGSWLVLAVLPPWSNSIHTHWRSPSTQPRQAHLSSMDYSCQRYNNLPGRTVAEGREHMHIKMQILLPASQVWSCDDLLQYQQPQYLPRIPVSECRTAFGVSQADHNSLTKASGWEHLARRTSKMWVAQGQAAPGNSHLRSNVCTAGGMSQALSGLHIQLTASIAPSAMILGYKNCHLLLTLIITCY